MIMIHVNVNNFENRNLSSGSRLLRQVQMCDSKKEHCVGHIVLHCIFVYCKMHSWQNTVIYK